MPSALVTTSRFSREVFVDLTLCQAQAGETPLETSHKNLCGEDRWVYSPPPPQDVQGGPPWEMILT